MIWNYRIVRERDKNCRNGYFYRVCEVYYSAEDKPQMFCDASIAGETLKECYENLQTIITGMGKAYLKFPDDFEGA